MNRELIDSKRHDLQYKTNEAANIIVDFVNGNIHDKPKMINKLKIRLREISEISEQLYNMFSR